MAHSNLRSDVIMRSPSSSEDHPFGSNTLDDFTQSQRDNPAEINLIGIKEYLEVSKPIDYDDETQNVPYYTKQMKREIHGHKWKGSRHAHIVEDKEMKNSRDHEMYTLRKFKEWSEESIERRYLMTKHECWVIYSTWPLRNESQQSSDPSEPVESLSPNFTDHASPLSPEPSLM